MESKNDRSKYLISPALVIGLFIVAAYGYFALSSLFLKGPPGTQFAGAITLENYWRVLSSGSNQAVLLTTLWASFVISLITVAVAVPMAMVIVRAKREWVGTLIMLAIAVTFLSGGVTRAYSWLILLGNKGLINLGLTSLGIIDAPIRFLYNWTGVGISIAHYLLPFAVFTLIGAVRNLNTSVEEAARSLGANRIVTFWRITMPMLLPGLMVTLVLAYSIALASFLFPMVLGGGKVRMIANQIYDRMFVEYDIPYAAATAVIFLVGAFASIWLMTFVSKKIEKAVS
ncbi:MULTISPECIES: ABC transporter permease [unclassified Devosia]|uniref:ABC transporter permease n=1 Tax=unclassified Devosia TaxID=196773 RepID=UPI00145F03C9|nr:MULTISPECIES: ABC transporter permease [unclassified Devosia]MBJ6988064.1 ABC transporter permease [Devosia sp. MC521]MBJ7577635.1 ABC transporter permease [Devosia sp. MC532]MBK1794436.1 ABC transporter permease [Devosia sp. WQ 349K1]QMW63353.1 ABC transporter permease [Devosia sp. MC521]